MYRYALLPFLNQIKYKTLLCHNKGACKSHFGRIVLMYSIPYQVNCSDFSSQRTHPQDLGEKQQWTSGMSTVMNIIDYLFCLVLKVEPQVLLLNVSHSILYLPHILWCTLSDTYQNCTILPNTIYTILKFAQVGS